MRQFNTNQPFNYAIITLPLRLYVNLISYCSGNTFLFYFLYQLTQSPFNLKSYQYKTVALISSILFGRLALQGGNSGSKWFIYGNNNIGLEVGVEFTVPYVALMMAMRQAKSL